VTLASVLLFVSCSRHRTLDFSELSAADLIIVTDLTALSDKELRRIQDPTTIAYVHEFLNRHQAGWREPFGGPPIPEIRLEFYADDRRLGGVGLDSKQLIADPTTQGWWSSPLSSNERDQFLRHLGVTLPKSEPVL
jgi:hypothetical protein